MAEQGRKPPAGGGDEADDTVGYQSTVSERGPRERRDSDAPEILAAGTVVDRFVIQRALGSGGAGVVYAARDPDLDRTVALKLLHPQVARNQHAQARFLREAQALAKLSHPNVIAIFDIGAFEDRAFIAMEFIDGATLRGWLGQRQRSWREVVAVMSKAGRGLAAAHAVGLTHRDFKPDNVLVGDDGRVLVTDFGLARAITDDGAHERDRDDAAREALDLEERRSASGSVLSHTLTRTGLVLGTPAYMAPEQWFGEPTGPKADQFSFCVTLYEALFGRRPFARTAVEDAGADTASRLRQLPRGHKLPPPLVRALLRGLESEPADRHSSMDAVLAQLGAAARGRRRGWIAAAAVAACALGGAAFYLAAGDDAELCAGASERLAGVWDDSARRELAATFAATDLPYAADTWARIEPVLDAYAADWAALHTGACEATRVHHSQSEALLDLQMVCLDGRRRELAELVALLRQPSAQTIEHAARAVHALTPLDHCADLEALAQAVAPPRDAATGAQVEALRAALARAKVLGDTGSYPEALELAAKTAAQAGAVDYAPVRAEALQRLGDVQLDLSQWQKARASLEEAIWHAEASGHDAIAALALTDSVLALTELAAYDEADAVARRAEAAVVRAGNPEPLRARLANSRGALALRRGDYQQAADYFEQALAATRRVEGDDSPRVGSTLHNLGVAAGMLGHPDQALEHYRRALDIERAALGAEHPSVATTRHAVGRALSSLGQHDAALEQYQKAIAILEPLGSDDAMAQLLTDVGVTLRKKGRLDEAETALRRVLSIHERSLGTEHPLYGQGLNNLGNVLYQRGQIDQAIELFEQNLAILEKALGPEHVALGRVLVNLCLVRGGRGEHQQALPHCQRALAIHESVLPAEHPMVLVSLVSLADTQLAAGGAAEAAALYERALALHEQGGAGPAERAAVRFSLARALWQARLDRGRATELARAARAEYAEAGGGDQLAAVDDWLRAHGTRP